MSLFILSQQMIVFCILRLFIAFFKVINNCLEYLLFLMGLYFYDRSLKRFNGIFMAFIIWNVPVFFESTYFSERIKQYRQGTTQFS